MIINYAALVSRVIELLTDPKSTLATIRGEPDHGRDLVLRYVFLLALIPTFFGFLGNLLFGEGFLYSLVFSILMLGVFIGSVFVMGLMINTMAPSFGTVRNEGAAFKLIAYASTPVWVAGFLTLVPSLAPVAVLVGFGYAIYLFYLGCQELMETPAEKAFRFSIATVGTWFAMVLVVALVVSQIAFLLFAPALVTERLAQPPTKPPGL
jgi:hypothetical protein